MTEVQPDQAQDAAKAPEPNYYDQLLRLKAEFENYRKRVDRERPEYVKLGAIRLLERLLPIYDLLQAAHREVLSAHNATPLAVGMEGIFREFEKLFKEEGVTPMDPLGKPFDASSQEVLGAVDRADVPEGAVIDVLQNGYLLKDKVLRTAKVRIARKPALKKEEEPKS